MSELKYYKLFHRTSALTSPQFISVVEFGNGDEVYLKSEADEVIAHNKYKRCLAMASNCRLRARWFGDNAFYKKEQWALQWHRRWLELAEKFKEAK